MTFKLYNEDCLDRLLKLPDNSADLVFTSPPYNMNLRIRNGKYCSRQIVKELSTKYEGFDDNLPMDEYYNFNSKVVEECLRVSDLVFYNVQFLTGNKPALFKLIGDFAEKLKEFIIWDKVNAQPAIGQGVMNSRFEVILVFQNSNPMSRAFKDPQFSRGTLQNLWPIKRGKKRHADHGAVFPTELAEQVILNFSKPGQVVLDPFMGTGTTGEVSVTHGRDFIGVELLPSYYQSALENIREALPIDDADLGLDDDEDLGI